jgi:hypothetical protein
MKSAVWQVQLLIVLLLILSGTSRANQFPEITGWWVSTGGTMGMNRKQLIYGGETSFLYLSPRSVLVFGLVTDFVHDNRLKSNRMMIGPEIAYFFAGVDGGLALNFKGGKTYTGFSVRPFISFPFFVSPVAYYRHTKIFYSKSDKSIHEFGIQIKLALPLHKM